MAVLKIEYCLHLFPLHDTTVDIKLKTMIPKSVITVFILNRILLDLPQTPPILSPSHTLKRVVKL